MVRTTRRVTQRYDANADDELSLKVGQIITVLSIEDNGWAEGILDNQWVGWFPIDCAEEDDSMPPNNASQERLNQLRLDTLFKNADVFDGTVNKRDSMVLTVQEKLRKRTNIIKDFIDSESIFIDSMSAWMSDIESNSVFSALSKSQSVSLLEAMDDVINFHQVLLGSLEVVRSADPADQMFGGYFLDFIPFFSEVYLKLKSLLPTIVTFIIESNESSLNSDMISKLQFSADIHLPVQHVSKMINFSRRILNFTPIDHEDWSFSLYSWRSLRDAVKKIDQEVKEIESRETLNSFLEKLDYYDGPPLSEFGQLVRCGTLRIGDRRQIYHIYLMEKILFILKAVPLSISLVKKNKRTSFLSASKFSIQHQIHLNSKSVKAISTNDDIGADFFRISYFLKDRSIQSIDCYAFNKELKKIWVELLNSLVATQDRLLRKDTAQRNQTAEDLYQDLMSFIEADEPKEIKEGMNPPPVPPKDNNYFIPNKEEMELPSMIVPQSGNGSSDDNHSLEVDGSRDLSIVSDPFPYIDETDTSDFNIGNTFIDNELFPIMEEKEPQETIEEQEITKFTSFEEETTEEENQASYYNTSEPLTELVTDEEFLSDQEYAKLLCAYNEKVAQVEELKRQLEKLSPK